MGDDYEHQRMICLVFFLPGVILLSFFFPTPFFHGI